MSGSKKKAFLDSNACYEGLLDLVFYRNIIERAGWVLTEDIAEADLVLYSTCGVENIKENMAIKRLRQLQDQKRADAEMVVCGCLPQINEERLKEVFDGKTFGPREPEKLCEMVGLAGDTADLEPHIIDPRWLGDLKFPSLLKQASSSLERFQHPALKRLHRRFSKIEDTTMYYIKTGVGCRGHCSYCAIKNVKGDLRSKPAAQIVEEFRAGLDQGYDKIILAGDDLGCYGHDIGTDIVALVRRLLQEDGDYQVGFRFLEPNWFIQYYGELKALLATGRIFLVSVPLQSGSNRVLELMNRRYDINEVVPLLQDLRGRFPEIWLRTHMMVGFPSETEQDFQQSMALLDAVDFDMVIPVIYCDRPGIAAASMPDKVPGRVGKARFAKMSLKILRNVYLSGGR